MGRWMDGVTCAMPLHAPMPSQVSRLGFGPQEREEGCVIHPVTCASCPDPFLAQHSASNAPETLPPYLGHLGFFLLHDE